MNNQNIRVNPVRDDFVARIEGVDLTHPISGETYSLLRQALDDHSVLIIPGRPLNDEQQVAFSAHWGKMEPTKGINPAAGTPFARQSNIDIKSGDILPADDRRMRYQKGNYLWHADSTFKRTPSLCSILSARQVPPEGGNTEFVSTRASYERLDNALQLKLDELTVEHDFAYSRSRTGYEFTAEEAKFYPSVWHPLVQTNPTTGRKSLLIGAHASTIVDKDIEEGRALLQELLGLTTVDSAIYSHHWTDGDVVIWDNRSVLHRATAYDTNRYPRLMQRTTISNPEILDSAAYQQIGQRRASATSDGKNVDKHRA